ncbi:hypothetical protein LCGC14_0715440 [marine sediment metagenome]|uniref:Uncharacterized protein n=1 Tax=marine sediment metagenome TaxID=412755 RepID=A0A0F9QI85_9ZZZZ|nr:hypothetical protein [archaeon]
MTSEIKKKKPSPQKVLFGFILLIIYLAVLFFFYNFFKERGGNPFIITLLLLFVFLAPVGLFLTRSRKSLYSRMFPDKKKRIALNTQRRKDTFKIKEIKQPQSKVFKHISLDFRYSKPLISKCENCGNILPNFVKKCFFCGKQSTT